MSRIKIPYAPAHRSISEETGEEIFVVECGTYETVGDLDTPFWTATVRLRGVDWGPNGIGVDGVEMENIAKDERPMEKDDVPELVERNLIFEALHATENIRHYGAEDDEASPDEDDMEGKDDREDGRVVEAEHGTEREHDEEREALRGLLREHSLKIGTFTLASGKTTDTYLDARLLVLRSDAAPLVGRSLLRAIGEQGWKPDAVGGMAVGAVPLVSSVVHAAAEAGRELHGFFVRNAAKEHGRKRLVEGVEEPSGPVVLLEDTVSTGGSTARAVEIARAAGFDVIGAVALVDREMGAGDRLAELDVRLVAVFRLSDLLREFR